MLWKNKFFKITGTLILGVALLLPGGVSQAAEESLIADQPFAVTQPEIMQAKEPAMLEVSEPESLVVSQPDALTISQPESLVPGTFPKGEYQPESPDYPAYDRCAKREGFDAQLECAHQAIDGFQE